MDLWQIGGHLVTSACYSLEFRCVGNPEGAISGSFTEAERERFHNLLKLAAESPFEGERTAALIAARRLADKHGMSLEEAAATGRAPSRPERRPMDERPDFSRFAQSLHLMDYHLHLDKMRRDEALRAARERGLDAEAARKQARKSVASGPPKRMNPERHAAVLLKETQLPFREVAEITGLDIYQVVGLKLKLRNPEGDIIYQKDLKPAAP